MGFKTNAKAEKFIIDKSKTQISNSAFRIRSFLCTFQSALITQVDKITLHAVYIDLIMELLSTDSF